MASLDNTGAEVAARPKPQVRYRSVKQQRRISLALKLLVVLLAVAFAIYPVVWVISSSFNPANALAGQTLIPANASGENYQRLFNDPAHPFLLWLWNSVKVSGITSIIIVIITALAAYSFSRLEWRGRRTGLLVILLIQLFPSTIALVALFLLLQQIGNIIPALGLNEHGGLILVYCGGGLGFNAWLMKGFMDSIPRELDESGLIDGASRWQIFRYIILPLARPVLAVIGILTFIGTYADFLLAKIMLKSTDKYTLAVGVSNLVQGQYNTQWGVFCAAALIGALPIVFIFLVLQRQLIGGLTQGSVKG